MEDLKLAVTRIEGKLDKVDERLSSIDVTLVKQNAELEHHIYRTDLAEKRLDILQSQIEPLSTFKNRLDGAFRVIGMVGTGVGIVIGLIKSLEIIAKFI